VENGLVEPDDGSERVGSQVTAPKDLVAPRCIVTPPVDRTPSDRIWRSVITLSVKHALGEAVKLVSVSSLPSMSHGPIPKLIRLEVVPVMLQVLADVNRRRTVAWVLQVPLFPLPVPVNKAS
jgi:hypothetical protein